MLTLLFITRTIIDCYIMLLLLCAWFYGMLNHYNPFYQLVVSWTQPLVQWSYRLLRPTTHVERPVILLTLFLLLLRAPLLQLLQPPNTLTLSTFYYLFIALLTLLKLLGNLLFWVLCLQALSSWGSSENSLLLRDTLKPLTAPLLQPIQKRLPVIQGLDFSIMVATLILIALDHLCYDLFSPLWNHL